jgi:hypothetical protein
MVEDAFSFMHDTSRPHAHAEVRAKILKLAKEIDALYKQHIRKSTNRTCEICGKGDNDEKYRVKTIIYGYEHREDESPCLCYNHSIGWGLSVRSILTDCDPRTMRLVGPDDRIDLHFAQYLAKQLQKEAKLMEKSNGPTT